MQASPWRRGLKRLVLPSVSQPEFLAFLPEPKTWAESQPFPCQGPMDLPIREPGQQPCEARGPNLTLPSWPA